jgi:hypothetical protein
MVSLVLEEALVVARSLEQAGGFLGMPLAESSHEFAVKAVR